MSSKKPARTAKSYQVSINYRLTLERMIAECAFHHYEPNISSANFKINGTGVTEEEVFLVQFRSEFTSTKEAIAKLAKRGLEPARLEHALALAKKYPDVQRMKIIIFLGSSYHIDNVDLVPYLGGDSRKLVLSCAYYPEWSKYFYFAAVRRSPKAGKSMKVVVKTSK